MPDLFNAIGRWPSENRTDESPSIPAKDLFGFFNIERPRRRTRMIANNKSLIAQAVHVVEHTHVFECSWSYNEEAGDIGRPSHRGWMSIFNDNSRLCQFHI